jgi:hypothetical protein
MPRLIRSVLAILAVCLLLGVMWRYYIQRTHLLQEIQANLEVSAQQQTAVIREFRKLWLDNVNVALMLQYVSPLLEKWMQNPPDTAEIQSLIATLRSTQSQYQFRDALFIKPSGQLYFRLNAQAGDLTERSRQAIAEAFRTKKALLTDIYREPDSGSLLIDQVVPSFIGSGDSAHPSGAVIYQYSAEQLLIPGPSEIRRNRNNKA